MIHGLAGFLLAALPVVFAGRVFGAQAAPDPNRRIVLFDSIVGPEVRVKVAQRAGWTVLKELRLIHGLAVTAEGRRVETLEARLKSQAGVLTVDRDPYLEWIQSPETLGDIPLPSMRELFERGAWVPVPSPEPGPTEEASDPEVPWGVARVNAPKAWPVTRGAGVRVAILDTGIDVDHTDLKANIAGGTNATDRDKEGDFRDDHGHGTWVSGIVAAVQDQAGVVGVGPQISLYGVKVLNAQGRGYVSDIIWGLGWCVDNKMDIVNTSFGATQDIRDLRFAFVMAYESGVTLVASAGNEGRQGGTGRVTYPGAYEQVMAVSASDEQDKFAAFSSKGRAVDFIAPGVKVPSTIKGGGTKAYSGTSASAPHVTGLAALAITRGAKKPEQVEAALKKAAEPLPGVNAEEQGSGLINAAKIVE